MAMAKTRHVSRFKALQGKKHHVRCLPYNSTLHQTTKHASTVVG